MTYADYTRLFYDFRRGLESLLRMIFSAFGSSMVLVILETEQANAYVYCYCLLTVLPHFQSIDHRTLGSTAAPHLFQ
jgi:hypothetical protein